MEEKTQQTKTKQVLETDLLWKVNLFVSFLSLFFLSEILVRASKSALVLIIIREK